MPSQRPGARRAAPCRLSKEKDHGDLGVLGAFEVAENGDTLTGDLGERHRASVGGGHGSGSRRQAAVGHDGAHDQGRPAQASAALWRRSVPSRLPRYIFKRIGAA